MFNEPHSINAFGSSKLDLINPVQPELKYAAQLQRLLENTPKAQPGILRLFETDLPPGKSKPTVLEENIAALSTGEGIIVCVVVPALNESTELPKLLDSLHQQKTEFPLSVVIADNGSDDDTHQIALNQGASVTTCLIPGIGPTRQAGLNFVLTELDYDLNKTVIVQIDADEELDPGYIQAVAAEYKANQNTMVTIGPTHYIFETPTGVRQISNGREFIETFQIPTLRKLFKILGRDLSEFINTANFRMLPGGNTTYRASAFLLPGVNYPDGKEWESIVMSLRIQQHIQADSIKYLPGQKLITSSRGFTNDDGIATSEILERIKQTGHIPTSKLNDSINPLETLRWLINQIDRETYFLQADEEITAVLTDEEISFYINSAKNIRIVPAVNAQSKKPIPNKFVLIRKIGA